MTKSKLIIPKIPKDLFKYAAVSVAIVLLVLYGIFFLKINFKTVLVIFGFILIGAISRLPQRLAPVAIGIELVSLVTIVSAILHGPLVGALVGVAASALSGFYTIESPQDVVVMSLGFAGVGILAPLFYNGFGLKICVLALTILYDLFTGVFHTLTGHAWIGSVRFAAVHIPVNYLIITWLGPKLLIL